jgi:hypothetical protein
MKVDAGLINDFGNADEDIVAKRFKNFFHINSRKLIEYWVKVLQNVCGNVSDNDTGNVTGNVSDNDTGNDTGYFTSKVTGNDEALPNSHYADEEERFMLGMLYYSFFAEPPERLGYGTFADALMPLCVNNKGMIEEIIEILEYNYQHIDFIDKDADIGAVCPLNVYCSYSVDQIMAAFGYFNESKKPSFREGVKYFNEFELDAFFVTLNKSEKDYSPSTLYEDYAINERLFHWQSQSRTSVKSPTGQRYINHLKTGNKIVLFVRENKKSGSIAEAYTFLGEAEYVSHSGDMPISFIWRMKEEIPGSMMQKANKGIV